MDYSEAPELEEVAAQLLATAEEWERQIIVALGAQREEHFETVDIRISNEYDGVAFCRGSEIVISAQWLRDHPDDIGVVVHELVHAIQRYPGGQPGWLVEGIADYIRWHLYEGPINVRVDPERHHYTQGYQVTAAFIAWIVDNHHERFVQVMNHAMRHDRYEERMFRQLTGMTVEELWEAYVAEATAE